MKHMMSGFLAQTLHAFTRTGLALTLLLGGFSTVHADRVVTTNGQTIEGVIKDENAYYLRINVKGIIIPIPKERIKEVAKNTLEENVQMLLERATEAISRGDISTARTLVEQARTLNTAKSALVENLNKLDQEITDLESRGGTPEERRLRAQSFLDRAKEAYDLIKNDEGNQLLIQALKSDPTYEPAHAKINDLLRQENPDLNLAAEYFAEVLWPDHLKMDSPVIPMLPAVYDHLTKMFEGSNDMQRSAHYAHLIQAFSEGFASHPSWKEKAPAAVREKINKPVDTLLADLIRNNLAQGNFELAQAKLQGWTTPDKSVEIARLYIRAYIGSERFSDALKILDQIMKKFPDNLDLRPQYNALKLTIQGQQAQEIGDATTAISTFETVYASRENLVPELVEAVGRHLAVLRAPEMETAQANAPGWRAADVAALIMRYGQDVPQKRRAAEIMISAIQVVSWRLAIAASVNGSKITLPDEINQSAMKALGRPLAVRFDPQSPFVIHFMIDFKVEGKGEEIAQTINSGQTVTSTPPPSAMGFAFALVATHATLGQIYRVAWTSAPLAAPPVQATPAAGVPAAAPVAPKPAAPGAMSMMPGGPPGSQSAPKPGAPVTPAAATPGSPAPGAAAPAPTAPPVPQGLEVKSIEAIKAFIQTDLVRYLSPDVTLLPSHLSIPMAQDILQQEYPEK